MAKTDLSWCIMHTINVYEGGYTNNKNDPGGPTIWGITIADWSEAEHHAVDADFVKSRTKADAVPIYEHKYANAMHFAELPTGPDYALYDYAVHSGIGRPPRVAQTLLKLPVTGKMDLKTVDAINNCDHQWFCDAVCQERDHFLRAIKGGVQYKNFPGWGKRVVDIERICEELVSGKLPPQTGTPQSPTPKGTHAPDPKITGTIAKSTTGGAIATQGAQAWNPTVAIALGAGVLALGAIAYIEYHRRMEAKNNTVVLPPTFGLIPGAPSVYGY